MMKSGNPMIVAYVVRPIERVCLVNAPQDGELITQEQADANFMAD
jgi:hypothetical protein